MQDRMIFFLIFASIDASKRSTLYFQHENLYFASLVRTDERGEGLSDSYGSVLIIFF